MRKLLLFMFAVVAFAACEQAPIEEQSAIRPDAPETITVGFEGDETRIQLNEAQKTVWNSGDEVSVFYRSNGNQKWQYKGEDGVRQATLSRVQNATGSTSITKTVVVYPYNETYWLNTDSYCIEATTPATQHYAVDSYGVGDNLMVSQGEFTQFSLKNVYGWLKLQLTGDGETIKSIKFRGNDGEQVAGLIYVDTATAEATLAAEMGSADDNNAGGNLVFEDTILTEVALDCGEGVALGKNATAFYIALPPQTFDDGFTVEVACVDGSKMVKSSNKALSIERNHIQPMAEFSYTANISPSNQIWYTSSNGNIVKPYDTDVFGANIISNTYNNGKGVIKFDGPLTKIGKFAFYSCGSLTSVTIPDSVTEIGSFAFDNCGNLTNVTIPDSVIEIGDSAFYDCQKLINIIFSENITTIGEAAFGNCKSFTCITIPDNVTSIGDGVFRACSNLTEFKGKFSEDNGRILVVDGRLVALAPAGLTEYTIPDSVTTIGYSVFWNSSYLTSITIPDSVTTIGENAFQHCSALVNINIPNGVTAIGDDTFYNCIKLPKITIPESVSVIGNQAFYNCSKLEEVTIPDSVTTIGYGAFHSCDNLTKFSGKFAEDGGRILVVDGSLVAFAPAGLTEYSIPDYVTSISGYTFRECHNLTQVTIPYNTSIIGSLAFHNCSSLTSIYIKALTPPVLDYSPFNANASNRKIYVPSESVDAYKSAASWSEYADAIVGYDFEKGEIVEVQPNNQIWYTSDDGKVVTPYNTNAFGATIVSNTYSNGKGVITFDGDVTSIGEAAFTNCYSLTNVTIPDSVTSIGNNVFYSCHSLTSVTIGNSVTTIGYGAFSYCKSLTSVNIPDSVTSIGDYAFYYCTSLTSVTIGDSVTTIGYYAFAYCDVLTSVTIGDSVTTIGGWAFSQCPSLTSVNIPDSVTTIGEDAFAYCTSLTSVYCKATTPPALDRDVFDYNGSGRKIYVPTGSVNAYKTRWNEYADAIVGYNF